MAPKATSVFDQLFSYFSVLYVYKLYAADHFELLYIDRQTEKRNIPVINQTDPVPSSIINYSAAFYGY